jgi:hypothetical protein
MRFAPRSYGLEGRPSIARGEPRFAAEPRDHTRINTSGEPKTLPHTGVFRARNNPVIALPERRKTGIVHLL